MLITPCRAVAGSATARRDTCHYDHPRSHSDTKTARSRRALDMLAQAIGDLAHREGRVTGQVLAIRDDYELDAATIRVG